MDVIFWTLDMKMNGGFTDFDDFISASLFQSRGQNLLSDFLFF